MRNKHQKLNNIQKILKHQTQIIILLSLISLIIIITPFVFVRNCSAIRHFDNIISDTPEINIYNCSDAFHMTKSRVNLKSNGAAIGGQIDYSSDISFNLYLHDTAYIVLSSTENRFSNVSFFIKHISSSEVSLSIFNDKMPECKFRDAAMNTSYIKK